LNKKISKENFEEIKKDIFTNQERKEKINNFLGKQIKIAVKNYVSENISWEFLYWCKNCFNCYDLQESINCKNVERLHKIEDSMDCFSVKDASLLYECLVVWNPAYNTLFSSVCWNWSNNMLYSMECYSSSNLFWCVWLRDKSYCILNKQYTKEEYEKLVPKIIENMSSPQPSPEGEGVREWWEFFPSSLSPFGYNETVAQEYFPINPPVLADIPLNKGDSQIGAEAGGFFPNKNVISSEVERPFSEINNELSKNNGVSKEKIPLLQSEWQNFSQSKTGLKWEINYIDREWNIYKTLQEAGRRPVFKYSTYEATFPKVEKIIPASKLPENISEIPDDILNWAIECEERKTRGLNPLFKILPQELEFYRKHNLPIPRKHPDQRHLDRMALRNPRKLFTRKCDKCGKEIQTTSAPERQETVYCQECYEKEIY
jgi:hypothetical protein